MNMHEPGTFPHGVTNEEGSICREFYVVERSFRHSLELAHDPAISNEKLQDPVYYDAAIISKRLQVPGVTRVTPEMVLDLLDDDADALTSSLMTLGSRRAEFRRKQQAAPEADDSAAQAGGALGGSTGNAAVGGGQPAAELPGDSRSQADETEGKKEESLT